MLLMHSNVAYTYGINKTQYQVYFGLINCRRYSRTDIVLLLVANMRATWDTGHNVLFHGPHLQQQWPIASNGWRIMSTQQIHIGHSIWYIYHAMAVSFLPEQRG